MGIWPVCRFASLGVQLRQLHGVQVEYLYLRDGYRCPPPWGLSVSAPHVKVPLCRPFCSLPHNRHYVVVWHQKSIKRKRKPVLGKSLDASFDFASVIVRLLTTEKQPYISYGCGKGCAGKNTFQKISLWILNFHIRKSIMVQGWRGYFLDLPHNVDYAVFLSASTSPSPSRRRSCISQLMRV